MRILVKYSLLYLLVFSNVVIAQYKEKARPNAELGVFIGGSYYIGDLVSSTDFYKFTKPAAGLLFRRNFNPRWGLRFNAFYGNVEGDDAKSTAASLKARNLNFRSIIIEASAQFEFNYLEYKFGSKKNPFSSYLFAGIGAFHFNPKANVGGSWVKLQPLATEGKNYTRVQPSIPFGIGFKQSLGKGFGFSVEWGMRKTTTDYLDDVSTVYVDPNWLASTKGAIAGELSDRSTNPGIHKIGYQRGNSKNKDWYSFVGLILSFKISEKPESCPGYN
ncbi:MAG: hypothetical protein J0M08_02885 [Bacteroidetes bacterium]|nr:hypothetical protein [Bacteroidota bacterium]